ncbi:MAG: tRNA (adenosine(37)-N6)-dimethylallyltransferase MiaA [Prevotella sp.]|nr:tRNA (adenosine(37)-N6)-dimethylallyltransferase MiaA [Prevotella sp.]
MKTLVVVVGPTGVGKTETCLDIAEYFKIPIINADSRQIYAELPIGTAAPTPSQQRRVKHFFVGNLHIEDYYNASMFENDVLNIIKHLFEESDIAMMSGGSMMYIDAVCDGIDEIPTIDEKTRLMIKQRYESDGLDMLCKELKILDPEYYDIVDLNNTRRVIHAIEICTMTGKTYTSFRSNVKKQRPFNIIKVGLERSRERMYERINARVLTMIEEGIIKEAKKVYSKRTLNSLNTVGYKELFEYFDGSINKEEAIRQIQSNTRRYCRKQLTWFHHDDKIKWFGPSDIEEIIKYITLMI